VHPFAALLRACGCPDDAAAERLAAEVVARYGEPQRHYHTLEHAAAVDAHAVALGGDCGLAEIRAVRLAAWLHDVVYDPYAGDNEDRSAVFAADALAAAGIDAWITGDCVRLIRRTADHRSTALDEAVLCDADLRILAAEPARYAEYTRQVRAEYALVPEAQFRAGRAQVLRGLLDAGRLYTTAPATAWEQAARANVEAELYLLER
jgi:predicted metal-dependent HD superfamily phosphohydrolase